MGLEFLARVRHTSVIAGFVTALFAAAYASYATGVAVGVGVAWSLANLALLETFVVALTGPDRRGSAATRRASLAVAGTLGLLGVAAWLLPHLVLAGVAFGFTVPFAVLLLKAVSMLLLETGVWRRLTEGRWRAALLVGLALAAALVLANVATRPLGAATDTTTTVAGTATAGSHAVGATAAGAAHKSEESEPLEFPNLIGVLAKAGHGTAWGEFLHHYEPILYSLIVAVLVSAVMIAAARRVQKVPGGFTNVIEMLVERLYDTVVDTLGPRWGPRFVPFLGTQFLYIWVMNLFGQIPLMFSPTSSLNVTVALALTAVVYAHYTSLREMGFLGWLDHLAGSPRSAIEWCLLPLIFPIHVIGELAKPVSLSCRLFGNIFGEDMLLAGFASLGITALAALHVPFGIPLHFPFLFLALLTSTVQALVFTMLSTIYILLLLPHDEHGHEGEAQPAH
jgi:F-type H+-transporting ATPase subunit a